MVCWARYPAEDRESPKNLGQERSLLFTVETEWKDSDMLLLLGKKENKKG